LFVGPAIPGELRKCDDERIHRVIVAQLRASGQRSVGRCDDVEVERAVWAACGDRWLTRTSEFPPGDGVLA